MRPPILLAALAAVAAAVALPLILLNDQSARNTQPRRPSESTAAPLGGAELPPGVDAPDFALTDQRGRRTSLASYRRQVVVLTFLSPSCGRVCIVLAQQIRGALDELAQKVPVLAVSTDPAGDSRRRTERFLEDVSLTGRMRFLSGPPGRLAAIWRAYHLSASSSRRVRLNDATALVLLVDRRGRERFEFPLDQLTPEALSARIRGLLAER